MRAVKIECERPNVRIVRELDEAFTRRDLESVFRVLDHRVEYRQSTEVPWGGDYVGHEGVREFYTRLRNTVSSTVVLERLIDAGDEVEAIGRTQGTVIKTGRSFDVPIAHIWTLKNALATYANFNIDNPSMLAALREA